jgi:hypothetical protein
MNNCQDLLCRLNIRSSSDFRKYALLKKKELINNGIVQFEDDPMYKQLIGCKQEDEYRYPSLFLCNLLEKQRNPIAPRGDRIRNCPKGTRRNKTTGNCDPKYPRSPLRPATPPVRPAPQPARPGANRCPKGTRRNKITGLCEPNNRNAPPPARPGANRCPNGTRRNKKTGLCEPK